VAWRGLPHLRGSPNGARRSAARPRGARRRRRGHRHYRQDPSGFHLDVGGHAGRERTSVSPRRAWDRYDESDAKVRTTRRSRPRSKNRPRHDDAEPGVVVTIDRGRYTCLVGGLDADNPDRVLVTAAQARELGRRSVVVGDEVDIVGDLSGRAGTLARIVRVRPRRTTLRRTADDTDPYERVVVANAEQMLMVTSVADPEPRPRLIDRRLVAAFDARIQPTLSLTQTDPAVPTRTV